MEGCQGQGPTSWQKACESCCLDSRGRGDAVPQIFQDSIQCCAADVPWYRTWSLESLSCLCALSPDKVGLENGALPWRDALLVSLTCTSWCSFTVLPIPAWWTPSPSAVRGQMPAPLMYVVKVFLANTCNGQSTVAYSMSLPTK